ncbi:MAG: helix-turn-helix domain-containing protein [Bacteroidales bacterium]|nr:helix-turn-helix domain-containing protein [Bacteroidales bacterium]
MTLEDRLSRIEAMLTVLVQGQQAREWYSVEEFARLVGRSEFTCRQWCRLGRIRAEKKQSGRGAYASWAISHQELERFRREGLLPVQ